MPTPRLLAKITLASCAKVQDRKNQWAWTRITEGRPDLAVLLGDTIYGRGWRIDRLERRFAQQNALASFAYFKENTPFLATWDDHDFGPNNAKGGEPEAQFLLEDGRTYRQAARDLFRAQLAPSIPNRRNLSTVRGEIYCSYRIGTVHVIVLDGRYYREDPDRVRYPEFLGQEQELWLWEQFARAKREGATATIVCCGSTISSGTKFGESLRDFEDFYSRFSNRFRQCPNPIFASGDIHQNRIRVHDGFLEVISSGVALTRQDYTDPSGTKRVNINNYVNLFVHDTHLVVTLRGADSGKERFAFPLSETLPKRIGLNERHWLNAVR